MSQENVEIVAAALANFVATGEPSWDRFHPDIVVHDHDLMDAGEYRGHAGFRAWLENWESAWSEYSMEPEELLDAGERVVVAFKMTAKGRGSGVEVERQDALVYDVRDGMFVRIDYYGSRQQALEAVGLEG